MNSYVYCPLCDLIYPGWNCEEVLENHPSHGRITGIKYPGVHVQLDFITPEEEIILMDGIDNEPWDISQSGRRKQNYGPKTNFKKKKLRLGNFKGFPEFSKFIQEKLSKVEILKNYQTIEQCSLEYDPEKGASIDPHIDDCWIWGERVVTVNCLSDSVLTMTKYVGDVKRYNLELVEKYKNKLIVLDEIEKSLAELDNIVIRIPMPRRSLIVLYGPARYEWEHCVLRDDIKTRRVCVAYREFTPFYLPEGDSFEEGCSVLREAVNFWTNEVQVN